MWPFSKKEEEVEKKVQLIHTSLQNSFQNVKGDVSKMSQWLTYLYNQQLNLQNQLQKLTSDLSYIPKSPEQIREMIDSYYGISHMHKKLNDLDYKLSNLSSPDLTSNPEFQSLKTRVNELEQRPVHAVQTQQPKSRAYFKEKLIKQISRNSKDYIKNMILSLIKKYEKVSALNLREMIVEEQGLASKSAFYRILQEIEKDEEVDVFHDGKEKVYVYTVLKKA